MQWLRKYDAENRQWTDEVVVATEMLAKRPDMYEVSEDTARRLQKMKEERLKRETSIARQTESLDIKEIKAKQMAEADAELAAEEDSIIPGDTVDTPEVPEEPQSPEALLEDLEKQDPEDNAVIREDDLDDYGRRQLFKLITEEELDVKKQGTSDELRAAIREARKAKKAEGEQ
jgi:hypothetical protein